MTTCSRNHPTSAGIKDPLSLKLLIQLPHLRDPQTSHLDSLFRTYTRLVVLELFQSEELKLVSSNPVWSSLSPHLTSKLKSSQLKCIMKLCLKQHPETMSVSTSRTSPSRISREVMSALIQRTTLLENVFHSWLKSSSSITQDKSKMDIAQYLIAILPTLPANSLKFSQRTTEEQEKLLKRSPNSSSPEMLP